MTRALSENSPEKDIASHNWSIEREAFMPGAFRWRTPDVDDDPPTPPLENGWAQPALPLEKFAYRLHTDGSLEFKGHLDGSVAVSGTVALTLPEPVDDEDLEPNYRLPNDQFFLTVLEDETLARVTIVAATGEVIITFPVS